jgi:hypothetical protein
MEPPSRPPYEYGKLEIRKSVPARPQVFVAPRPALRRHPEDPVEPTSTKVLRGILWTLTLLIVGVLGLGLLYVLTVPKISHTKDKLERKQTADVMMGLQEMAANRNLQSKLHDLGDVRGEKFYEAAFKAKLLDEYLTDKLVSRNSESDATADRDWITTNKPMPPNSCSYTAPRADMLLEVLMMKGDERCVVFCFNSRNWHNYPDHGVLVHFSDGDVAEYMTFEDAHENWGITEEEWEDPAGKLFGKKPPFHHTYE